MWIARRLNAAGEAWMPFSASGAAGATGTPIHIEMQQFFAGAAPSSLEGPGGIWQCPAFIICM